MTSSTTPAITSSIRRKMLMRFLPLMILPLIVIGVLVYSAVSNMRSNADTAIENTRSQVGDGATADELELKAQSVSDELQVYVNNNVAQLRLMAQSPAVVDAARQASALALASGFADLGIDEIEDQAPENNSLEINPNATAFLASQVGDVFQEIFFTDINGFNAGSTNLTSDFVQSDEEWWTQALANGTHLSDPEFDNSVGEITFDVAVTVQDPATGEVLGVMKAAMSGNIVGQQAALANAGSSDTITVATNDGAFLGGADADGSVAGELGELVENSRLTDIVSNPDSQQGVVLGDGSAHSYARANLVDSNWIVLVERDTTAGSAGLVSLDALSKDLDEGQNSILLLLGAGLLAGILMAIIGTMFVARTIVGPIQRLADWARRSADTTLPETVRAIGEMKEGDSLPATTELVMDTNDELEVLTQAVNTLQTTATDLAVNEASARRSRQDLFMNLGRRSQKMAVNQLDQLEDLEQNETVPETLEGLLKVDHLATRMRRNAESLLILADHPSPRKYRHAVPIRDLIRAAASEIGDYERVQLNDHQQAEVRGEVAGDVIHLLAELIDNAARFSDPETQVETAGRWQDGTYQIFIVDRGIGLSTDHMELLNARLADPALAAEESSSYLGLQVISRLCARHGIVVSLADGAHQGITAKVILPDTVVTRTSVDNAVATDKPAPVAKPKAQPVTVDAVTAVPDGAEGGSSAPVASATTGETTPSGFKRRTRKSAKAKAAPVVSDASAQATETTKQTNVADAASGRKARFAALQSGQKKGREAATRSATEPTSDASNKNN